MNTVAIVGEPTTGKSKLVRAVLPALGTMTTKLKLGEAWASYYSDAHTVVLGVYDGSRFEGTDKLAWHSQPHAVGMLGVLAQVMPDRTNLLFEGDRYATQSFLFEAQRQGALHVLALTAPADVLAQRLNERPLEAFPQSRVGLRVNDTWLKGRRTKIRNIVRQFNGELLPHTTEEDHEVAVAIVLSLLQLPAYAAGRTA